MATEFIRRELKKEKKRKPTSSFRLKHLQGGRGGPGLYKEGPGATAKGLEGPPQLVRSEWTQCGGPKELSRFLDHLSYL